MFVSSQDAYKAQYDMRKIETKYCDFETWMIHSYIQSNKILGHFGGQPGLMTMRRQHCPDHGKQQGETHMDL